MAGGVAGVVVHIVVAGVVTSHTGFAGDVLDTHDDVPNVAPIQFAASGVDICQPNAPIALNATDACPDKTPIPRNVPVAVNVGLASPVV